VNNMRFTDEQSNTFKAEHVARALRTLLTAEREAVVKYMAQETDPYKMFHLQGRLAVITELAALVPQPTTLR